MSTAVGVLRRSVTYLTNACTAVQPAHVRPVRRISAVLVRSSDVFCCTCRLQPVPESPVRNALLNVGNLTSKEEAGPISVLFIRPANLKDEAGFHSDLPDVYDSEIIVKADFVCFSSIAG